MKFAQAVNCLEEKDIMNFLSISHILFQNIYYSVPDYQRDYEWTNAQNSTLIEDVFSILEDPANTSDHFFGAL